MDTEDAANEERREHSSAGRAGVLAFAGKQQNQTAVNKEDQDAEMAGKQQSGFPQVLSNFLRCSFSHPPLFSSTPPPCAVSSTSCPSILRAKRKAPVKQDRNS